VPDVSHLLSKLDALLQGADQARIVQHFYGNSGNNVDEQLLCKRNSIVGVHSLLMGLRTADPDSQV
jgi:hypothetical protein